MNATEPLPLFPLKTVLFPGSRIHLRLFEQRYLDMLRDCAQAGSGFGVVCAWKEGPQRGSGHARVGTEALMVDFDQLEDGLLGVTCRGQRRFRIAATSVRDDGLLIGRIQWLPPEPAVPVPARFGALQTLMQELLRHRELAGQIEVELEDASSLSRALAANLALSLEHAQALLEMTDPISRLEGLVNLLDSDSASD